MQIHFDSIDDLKQYIASSKDSYSVAVGNFDGVHMGHQAVISKCSNLATESNSKACVLTFSPNSKAFFNGKHKYLYQQQDNISLIQRTLAGEIWILNFDSTTASASSNEFTNIFMNNNIRNIVTGYNFAYGHKKSGNTETLKQASSAAPWKYTVVPPISFQSLEVSSSLIKRLIQSGGVSLANRLLTRNYAINTECNISTLLKANQDLATMSVNQERGIQYPCSGIYSSLVSCGQEHIKGISYFIYENSLSANAGNKIALTFSPHEGENIESISNAKPLVIELAQLIRPCTSISRNPHQISKDKQLSAYAFSQSEFWL